MVGQYDVIFIGTIKGFLNFEIKNLKINLKTIYKASLQWGISTEVSEIFTDNAYNFM